MKTYSISLPTESIIASALPRIDYMDAFALRVPAATAPPLEKLPVLFFYAMPTWFGWLMGLREMIAGWIGLKTAKGINVAEQLQNFTGKPGESVALFQVMAADKVEIMTGENDSHLDFRLSFFAIPKGDEVEIILATTVKKHNLVGKLYFLPVQPIHRLIVPIVLKRMIKKWQSGELSAVVS